jgi:hypothetical protein
MHVITGIMPLAIGCVRMLRSAEVCVYGGHPSVVGCSAGAVSAALRHTGQCLCLFPCYWDLFCYWDWISHGQNEQNDVLCDM